MTTYATDGRCHNANAGSFNHECGRPAQWIGTSRTGFKSGYCDHCKQHGTEGLRCISWEPIVPLPASAVDVGTITEYGMTQKLSTPIRCF